jgi:hypothetical protein
MTLRACGPRNGDYLSLANQWARVVITKDTTDQGGHELPYSVAGDIRDVRLVKKFFKTWRAAMAYAFDSLSLFEQGRAD